MPPLKRLPRFVVIHVRIHSALSLMQSLIVVTTLPGMALLGSFSESVALQWAGFAAGVLTLALFGFHAITRDRGLTIGEARARLDELEAYEAEQ